MAAEGMSPDPDDIIVTTGGQQALDLIAKTLVDPGDVVDLRGAHLSGRRAGLLLVRGRDPPDPDGRRTACGSTSSRRSMDRLDAEGRKPEVHLLGAELPEPGRRDAVAGAPAALGGARAQPRGPRGRGQPIRAAPLRGRSAAAPVPARRRRLRDLRRDVLEDPLPGDPPRLGGRAASGDGEDRPRQAGDGPLHVDAQPSTSRSSTSPRAAGATVRRQPLRRSTGPAAMRCSRRSSATSRRRPPGPGPAAGSSSGPRCPDYIDTSDLLAKALRENVAFVPGRGRLRRRHAGHQLHAAELLGLRRGRDPRGDPPHRRGRRRAGRRSTRRSRPSTGSSGRRAVGARRTAATRSAPAPGDRPTDEGRGAEGGQLAGAPGVAALGRAGRGRAGVARARGGPDRRRRRPGPRR